MEYQQGQDREQLTLYSTCLGDMVPPDNSVRFIDQFVESMDLRELGFDPLPAQGRPPYNPADLLKLYIYGYMNRMRSSRQLEKECHRNLEVIWLLKNLKPDHNTIARFRKDNPKAIKRVFRHSVEIAMNFNLIGGVLIAGDSTKFRAQNSKKNNYNKKKIQRHLEYIDNKLEEHNKALATADGDKRESFKKQVRHRKEKRKKYEQLQRELDGDRSSENPQISTSDPDSRHQIVRGMITEVCYTGQTTVDGMHKILIDCKLTNQNDKKAMGMMLRRAKSILRTNRFTALYDKGYHTGSEFHTADQLGIETLVAIPAIGRKSQAPNPMYNAENFRYNRENKTKACKLCRVRSQCTTAKTNGKIIQRSQYAQGIRDNAKRVRQNEDLYRLRQALVEHPYGTIKRQWGFDHIMTKKGIGAASADFGLMALAYNLRRLYNLGIVPKALLTVQNNCYVLLTSLLIACLNLFGSQGQHSVKNRSFNFIFT